MFRWWQKQPRGEGLVALAPSADGQTRLAAVSRARGGAPRVGFLGAIERGNARGLRQLAERHALRHFPVSALLAEGDYQLLLVEAPDVRPEELRAAVRWRIKDLLDFHLDDAVIDVFEIPDQRHANRNRMMYAVAARTRTVSESVQLAEDAGLPVAVVDIPEMALRNLAALLPEESQGLALVHLEAGSGIVTVSRGGTLYLARRFDRGLRDFDDGRATSHAEAVLLEVQRSLDYYDSHFSHGPVAAVALTPPAANTVLADYLPARLDVAVLTPVLQELVEFAQPPVRWDPADVLALGAALRTEAKVL